MECFLPVPQFPPPKFGYHDTEPVSPTWAIKLCKKNKLKQNFPMDLPFLSDSWWSWCHTRIWALWFLHQHHKLRWKSCSSQPLPESLSGRSREMFPPVSHSPGMFVMQNCSCCSPGNNVGSGDKSFPRLLRAEGSVGILPQHWLIYVTTQHSRSCNFYNQIHN